MSAVPLETRVPLLPVGFVLLALLSWPGMRHGLESSLVAHMLVQLPLLVLGGWCMGTGLMALVPALQSSDWNRGGIPGLVVVVVSLLFWMLPKSLDAALDQPSMELAKFAALPFCLGAPLALSWPRAHPVLRGFLKAQCLSMLGALGFLYVIAPVRICNNYLVDEQQTAGFMMGVAAATLALWWGGQLFFTRDEPGNVRQRNVRKGFVHA